MEGIRHSFCIALPGSQSYSQFIVGAAVRAKNQALFPGRVPHVRLSVHGLKKMGRSPFRRSCWTDKRTAAKRKSLCS
jgi:hypothetical protein